MHLLLRVIVIVFIIIVIITMFSKPIDFSKPNVIRLLDSISGIIIIESIIYNTRNFGQKPRKKNMAGFRERSFLC